MTVGLGTTGHDPQTYQYHGRTHTAFTCIDWLLGGQAYLRPAHGAHAAAPRWRAADRCARGRAAARVMVAEGANTLSVLVRPAAGHRRWIKRACWAQPACASQLRG